MFKRISVYFLTFLISACQTHSGQAKEIKAQKVYRITYEQETNDWYKQQAKLWQKEIEKNPASEEAWYNYYNANRYARFEEIDQPQRQAKLQKIIDDMGKAIPETYTYCLLKYWNTYNCQDLSLIEKAYALNPERPDTYYPFISESMVKGNEKQLQEFCEKLYKSKDIAPWLMNYNYNVLMSVDEKAVLFTNGDNDTYPVILLQRVKKVRPDVRVINTSLLLIKEYFENNVVKAGFKLDYNDIKEGLDKNNYRVQFVHKFVKKLIEKYPGKALCFAVTVYGDQLEPFKDNLYLTGLAFRYSKERIDNIALVKKNLEKMFRLDYMKTDIYNDLYPGKRLRAYTNLNYVSSMLLLMEHYKLSGDSDQALYWKNFAVKLATEAGRKQMVEEINKKFMLQ